MISVLELQKALARTTAGRLFSFFLILAIFNLQTGCTVYKESVITMDEVESNEMVRENLDVYRFFIHSGEDTYQLLDPVLLDTKNLSGKLVLANDVKLPDESWTKRQKQKHFREHKYDIRITTNQDFRDLRASINDEVDLTSDSKMMIEKNQMEEVRITSINMDESTSKVVVVLLIIGGVILTVALIIVGFIASLNASDSEGSIESDSGSGDSNSGDSGSGASSDGSDASSGSSG